jgi:hypothetical protein
LLLKFNKGKLDEPRKPKERKESKHWFPECLLCQYQRSFSQIKNGRSSFPFWA